MPWRDAVGLGVAGNFTGHLEQAGESRDFVGVQTAEPDAPKGIFPFYLPGSTGPLGVYPVSSDQIELPQGYDAQIEPEVALVCDLVYGEGERVASIVPRAFAAFNDCSIRREGARKISDKKNWGPASKGMAARTIAIDRFAAGGILDGYRIASFLRRGSVLYEYGIDSPVEGYSYNHGRLLEWIVGRIADQADAGPLEAVGELLRGAGNPRRAVITIGATRYTPFGEGTYVRRGDELAVVVYPARLYSADAIRAAVDTGRTEIAEASLLYQRVI